MVAATAAVGGALLAVMIAFSWYGAVTLPPTARVPVHWGFRWGSYVPKRAGLIIWPALGALIYVVLGFVVPSSSHRPRHTWAPSVLMIVIMGAAVAFQAGALAAARRTVPDGAPPQ